jgi:hypothetical protein
LHNYPLNKLQTADATPVFTKLYGRKFHSLIVSKTLSIRILFILIDYNYNKSSWLFFIEAGGAKKMQIYILSL